MRIYKFQRLFSILPFFSTINCMVVSVVELLRRKATWKQWLYFAGILVVAALLIVFSSVFVLAGKSLFLHLLVAAVITTVANFLMVNLQERCYRRRCELGFPPENKVYQRIVFFVMLGYLIASAIIAFSLVIVLLAFSLSERLNYEDTNGIDNTSLQQITIDDLVSSRISRVAHKGYVSSEGWESGVEERLSDCDRDSIWYTYGKINGLDTLHATKAGADVLELTITSTLESGNAEIVIVVDGVYYAHVPINETTTVTIPNVKGKTVVVRGGFEAAQIDISIERQ